MNKIFTEEYLSEHLFHFWKHDPEDIAFQIFTSIIQRGLLLSRGNKGLIDRFNWRSIKGEDQFIDIVQKSRVCFTDIPEDKLSKHCQYYGYCAVGFARKTIIDWGGNPVIYLPNHSSVGSLNEQGAALVFWLNHGAAFLDILQKFILDNQIKLKFLEKDLSPSEARDKIEGSRQTIYHILSLIKEMSSGNEEDYRYLYEREWRIVSGMNLGGGKNLYKNLSHSEKAELIALVPDWGRPIQTNDPQISKLLSNELLIDTFCFFNGINEPVSKKIEVIFVPNEKFKIRVVSFIENNKKSFMDGGPLVQIFKD
ncbi:MAG: hypothetical protein JWQ09_4597 [Segetibacter sp.]|nr:hypothetical protein [Segetibacter sp.]